MDNNDYITDLRSDDVLLGRGSGPNDHEGNIRFRQLVAERKSEYMATNHRLTKAKIAQEIVDQVYANGGRFLRKLENDEMVRFEVPDGVDVWALATEDTIMEKAKQALRQNTNKTKLGLSDDPMQKLSPRRLSPNPSKSKSPVPSRTKLPGMNVPSLDDFEPFPLNHAYESDPVACRIPVTFNDRITGIEPRSHPHQQQQRVMSNQQHLLADHERRMEQAQATMMQPPTQPPQPMALPSSSFQQAPAPPPPPAIPLERGNTLDLQDDSILAHLPPHVRAHFVRGATAIAGGHGGGTSSVNPLSERTALPSTSSDAASAAALPPTMPAPSRRGMYAGNETLDQIPYSSDDELFPSTGSDGNNQQFASMTLNDLYQGHRRGQRFEGSEDNLSVVMDSFSKMKTPTEGEENDSHGGGGGGAQLDPRAQFYSRRGSNQTASTNRMLASTETMGTIEPINVGSIADMSFTTMNSSTFSVLRGNESSLRSFRGAPNEASFGYGISGSDMAPASPTESGGRQQRVVIERDPHLQSPSNVDHPAIGSVAVAAAPPLTAVAAKPPVASGKSTASGVATSPAGGRFEASFSHTELPTSRSVAAARYQYVAGQQNAAIREDYEEAHGVTTAAAGPPARPIRLTEDEPSGEFGIDGMGQSSMEMLKAAFQSSTDWDMSTNQLPVPQPLPPSDQQPPKRQHQ
jgi:hypothetical protein